MRVLQGQIERMSQQIGYQLQRASLRKSGLVRHREQLAPLVETLCDALDKVYRDKRVSLQRDFSPSFSVPVERGALLELLGNLLENAYRLCLGRVRVGARLGPGYSGCGSRTTVPECLPNSAHESSAAASAPIPSTRGRASAWPWRWTSSRATTAN